MRNLLKYFLLVLVSTILLNPEKASAIVRETATFDTIAYEAPVVYEEPVSYADAETERSVYPSDEAFLEVSGIPATPSSPLPVDSEFESSPSSYLNVCISEGEEFVPDDPPYRDPRCPIAGSSYDGANCFVASVPSGLTGFVYDNKLYTSPVRKYCPVGSYDGANCYRSTIPYDSVNAYASGMNWYYYSNYSTCSQGTKIGTWLFTKAICLIGTAPAGSTGAFIWGNAFYYQPLVSNPPCVIGSYDSANCFVATPPYGTQAFIWEGNLYHTPYSGPPVELWGNQSRLRGVMATIYIHGRNAGGSGPIYGWGYSAWNYSAKGPQPIWLAWDSTQRISSGISGVMSNLDIACKGPDLPCHVVCHSAGCLMITRILAENPGRYNVASVTAISGAQGGSEVANIASSLPWYIKDLAAYFKVLLPLDADLTTSAARNMYDHNQTSGVPVVTASGNWKPLEYADGCSWWMWVIASPYCLGVEAWNDVVSLVNGFMVGIFNGGHDGVLAYHSSAGFKTVTGSSNACNPSGYGYWTNYTSVNRRGGCYQGLSDMFHSDGYKYLNAWGTVPP
ncbi:hypothetical protein KKF34_19720 [Myxococcota bacterium]|nr:hypothetical protein [Myxococcota bacterium]MBU1381366.1 hypothetical protein [Myxococcota bacterium]MBU1499119.1 hypothetical protein [Myxococcota bacterium]